MTMIAARVATKSIETSRTVWLKRAAMSTLPTQNSADGDDEEARAVRQLRRQDERQPQKQERHPRQRVVVQRAHERDAGAARKVARVADPEPRRLRRCRRRCAASSPSSLSGAMVTRNDQRVPRKKAEGEARERDRDESAIQPAAKQSPRAERTAQSTYGESRVPADTAHACLRGNAPLPL